MERVNIFTYTKFIVGPFIKIVQKLNNIIKYNLKIKIKINSKINYSIVNIK